MVLCFKHRIGDTAILEKWVQFPPLSQASCQALGKLLRREIHPYILATLLQLNLNWPQREVLWSSKAPCQEQR